MTSLEAPNLIEIELHSKSIRTMAEEMAITLMRTSGSPVVTEALDFSTCILDPDVEQLAFAGFVTFHLSTALGGVRAVLERILREDLRPGDGFLCNDPHTSGAIHQGDLGIVMPFFADEELIGFGYVNEHVLDAGGSAVSGFAPGAHDNFSEALNFNAVRVVRDYRIEPEWEAFIANNVRMPRIVLNDIRSMVAANRAGERRLSALVAEIGTERFSALNSAAKDLSEQAFRKLIAKLPDGTYDSRDWVEYDGRGVEQFFEVRCRLVVDGDQLLVQYRGDDQTDSFVNGAWPAVVGQSWSTLLSQLCHEIPVNAGLWRPVTFDLGPKGSIVNAVAPAPVTQSHMETGMRINKLLTDVLSQACMLSEEPELAARVAGQPCQSLAFFSAFGTDRRTGHPILGYPVSLASGSGAGAQTVTDGLDTYAAQCMCGCNIPDVEIEESTQPGHILWRRAEVDTSGAGMRRGGMGLSSALAIVHCDVMHGGAFNSAAYLPARGAAGGLPASAGHWEVLRDTNVIALLSSGGWPSRAKLTGTSADYPAKTGALRLEYGDVFHSVQGGGGGLGDPLFRDPDAVASDVSAGFTSLEIARSVYGVVLGASGEPDLAATEAERVAIRSRRIGHAPRRAADPRAGFGPIARAAGRWTCASCGTDLGPADRNWRDVAVGVETPLAERYVQWRLRTRTAKDGPRPVVREYWCDGCGTALTVDVTFEGSPVVPAPRLDVHDPYPVGAL